MKPYGIDYLFRKLWRSIIIANKLGISPCECLYIGDTNTDIKTCISDGIDFVGVTCGFRYRK